MVHSTNPSIVMLDLRSSNDEIVLKALEEIQYLEDNSQVVPLVQKLLKNKNPDIQKKAGNILETLGVYSGSSRDEMIKTRLESMNDKEILDYFNPIITVADFEYFKPYLAREGRKPSHIISDVREKIQTIASSKAPKEKVKALFPVLFVPLEHKFKVNILLDLLRDTTPYVIVETFNYLDNVDTETLRKLVPVIVSKFKSPEGIVERAVMNFVNNLDKEAFMPDINNIQCSGMNQKTEKILTDKLLAYFK